VLVKPFFARRPVVAILLKLTVIYVSDQWWSVFSSIKQRETRHGRLFSVSVNAPSCAHLSPAAAADTAASAAERVLNAAAGATDLPNAAATAAIWISAHGVVASPSVSAAAAASDAAATGPGSHRGGRRLRRAAVRVQ